MNRYWIAGILSLVMINFCQGQIRLLTPLPDSRVNVGLGAGMNHGGFGTKTVIGFRNSGLLLGLGYMPEGFVGY